MKEFCVDLEIAKQLKEKGFKSETYFRYQIDTLGEVEIETIEFAVHDHVAEAYSAPISDELLKELPNVIIKNRKYYYLNIFRDVFNVVNPRCTTNYHEISYITHEHECLNAPNNVSIDQETTLPNALAKMWLNLKKEGYIK